MPPSATGQREDLSRKSRVSCIIEVDDYSSRNDLGGILSREQQESNIKLTKD